MANQLSVTQLVANLALAEFENNNSLLFTGSRDYESQFQLRSFRIGDTVSIRRQNFFNSTLTRVKPPQDVLEEVETLTISANPGASINFTAQEYTLTVDTQVERFNDRYVRPLIQEIVKQSEQLIADDARTALNFQAGTPGSPLNSFATIDLAGAKMLEQAMPITNNAYMGVNVRDGSALKSSLQNAFNPTLNEDISFHSALGHLSYFDIYQNQSIARQTAGSNAGTPLTNGAVTSGTTINIDGLTPSATGVYKAGDIITIDGVFSVNPIGRLSTGQLMQFVVQADVNANGGGQAVVTVSPSIISDPNNPRRNVSIAIPDNASVSLAGAGTIYPVNLAYCTRGLDIVIPPMEPYFSKQSYNVVSEKTGCNLLVTLDSDTINGLNLLRIEMLLGWKWHPQYAIRLAS